MLNENGKKPLIVSENLVKIYKVADLEVVALQGLDLVVERSEMLGIVGNSGSGKTTFLNILGGLDRPSAGRITVDELNLLTPLGCCPQTVLPARKRLALSGSKRGGT